MNKLIITVLLTVGTLSAEIDFTRISGLYTVFRTKQYCSPLFGFAWWNSGQIEKLYKPPYRYGDPEHATVQLVSEFFYLNEGDGLTFAPTILPNKIGTYITPGAIGAIIHILDEYVDQRSLNATQMQKLETALEAALAKEIKFNELLILKILALDPFRNQYMIDIVQQEVQRLEKQRVAIVHEREQAEHAVKKGQQEVVQLASQRKSLEKKKPQTPELQTQIQAKLQESAAAQARLKVLQERLAHWVAEYQGVREKIEQLKDTERRLENRDKNKYLSEDSLYNFVRLLVRAFQESLPGNQRYLPFTVHNILLGMLWKKATEKKDFILYFAKLDHSIFYDNSLLSDNSPAQQAWLEQRYDRKMYQTIGPVLQSIATASDTNAKFNILKINFELLIASWYSYAVFTSVFPPQVLSGWTSYEGNNFADCGSSSLRNALDNLMFVPGTGELLLSKLTPYLKASNRITNFYSKYGLVEQILEQKTRDAWVQVTSGLTSGTGDQKIDYKSPTGNGVCEIAARSGIRNMNNVMRPLLGINSINDFNKVPNVRVTEQLAKDPNFGVYTFVMNNEYTFKWYFDPLHFFISIDPRYVTTDAAITKFMTTIVASLQKEESAVSAQQNNMIISMLLLYRDRSSLLVPVVNMLAANDFPAWYRNQLIIALLDNRSLNQKLGFIRDVLAHPASRADQANVAVLKRLMQEIINDVAQYEADIVRVIIESPIAQDATYQFQKDFEYFARRGIDRIKENYPNLMPMIVDAILNNSRDRYYGSLKKNVFFTPEQLVIIIRKKIEPLYDNVRTYLKGIKMPLNKEDKMIIDAIHTAELKEFYSLIEKKTGSSSSSNSSSSTKS
jgi:hypothetical protein